MFSSLCSDSRNARKAHNPSARKTTAFCLDNKPEMIQSFVWPSNIRGVLKTNNRHTPLHLVRTDLCEPADSERMLSTWACPLSSAYRFCWTDPWSWAPASGGNFPSVPSDIWLCERWEKICKTNPTLFYLQKPHCKLHIKLLPKFTPAPATISYSNPSNGLLNICSVRFYIII